MKAGILFSNYMYSYIPLFLDLCEKNNIEVDFFKFSQDKISFEVKAKNIYEINTKWKPKQFSTNEKIEEEIKNLVNIDDYDYFLSDTMGLSFKNACNFFHGHTTKYKIEHTSKGIIKWILLLSHQKLIRQEKEYYKNTKYCFIGSNEMKIDYSKNCKIPLNKIQILPPGRDNFFSMEFTKKQEDRFIFGSVTCGFQLKGGYNILRAIRKLKKDFTPDKIKFRFINPKYDKQMLLKAYIKFFGIEKYVEFLPFYDNINEFYVSLDCLICASNAEAFGRVVIEAMTAGLPVITGSNVGACDIIENGVNGYIYKYDKNLPDNLANSIKQAYNERNNLTLKQNAKKTADEISWENFTIKVFNILNHN